MNNEDLETRVLRNWERRVWCRQWKHGWEEGVAMRQGQGCDEERKGLQGEEEGVVWRGGRMKVTWLFLHLHRMFRLIIC